MEGRKRAFLFFLRLVDETPRHSGTFLSPAIRSVPLTFTSSYHCVRPLANIGTTRTIERGLFQCMLKPFFFRELS